jgi:hypothetical protein
VSIIEVKIIKRNGTMKSLKEEFTSVGGWSSSKGG